MQLYTYSVEQSSLMKFRQLEVTAQYDYFNFLCFQFTKANLPNLESLALFHSIPLHFTRIMDHI